MVIEKIKSQNHITFEDEMLFLLRKSINLKTKLKMEYNYETNPKKLIRNSISIPYSLNNILNLANLSKFLVALFLRKDSIHKTIISPRNSWTS